MKKLSKEEAENMFPSTKGRSTLVRAMLSTLEVGELLIITRKDWLSKGTPFRVVNYFAKQSKRKFDKWKSEDGTGWYVKRME